jgi:hypothetical protein
LQGKEYLKVSQRVRDRDGHKLKFKGVEVVLRERIIFEEGDQILSPTQTDFSRAGIREQKDRKEIIEEKMVDTYPE